MEKKMYAETHRYMNFDHDSFDGKTLANRTFEKCVFEYCTFVNCDFNDTNFYNCIFECCDFGETEFVDSLFSDSSFYRCVFSVKFRYHSCITGCTVTLSNFENSKLFDTCDIHNSHFDECIFPENFDKRRFGEILEEDIIGWKKCKDDNGLACIVKLLIPKGSIVYSINGEKCRTNKCKVLDIISCKDLYENKVLGIAGCLDLPGNTHLDKAFSAFWGENEIFTYCINDWINIKNFDMDYAKECASGIHFFKDVTTAWNYGCFRK